MNYLFKKSLLVACCFLSTTLVFSENENIDFTKEKAQLNLVLPSIKGAITSDQSYKFILPAKLKYFDETQFKSYSAGFYDIKGSLNTITTAPRVTDNSLPAGYTFEIITSGFENFKPFGTPFTSLDYQNGTVQNFTYNFPCTLRVSKEGELETEYIINDANSLYKTTFYKNCKVGDSSFGSPVAKLGFASADEVNDEMINKKSQAKTFLYITEYEQYLRAYKKCIKVLAALYTDYTFKENVHILFVKIDKKNPEKYADFNLKSQDFLTTINAITNYKDLLTNKDKLKDIASSFEAIAAQTGVNNSIKVMALKNASYAEIILSNMNKLLDNLKLLDPIDKKTGVRLDQTISDFIAGFGVKAQVESYAGKQLIFSINDWFAIDENKALIAKRSYSDSIDIAMALKEEERLHPKEILNARNIIEKECTIWYRDGKSEKQFVSIIFYNEGSNPNLTGEPATELFVGSDINTAERVPLNSVASVELPVGHQGKTYTYQVLNKVDATSVTIPKVLTISKGATLKFYKYESQYQNKNGNYLIFSDETVTDKEEYIICPFKDNTIQKEYSLSELISNGNYGKELKTKQTVVDAINSGEIVNSYNSVCRLAVLLIE